ncbi:MAG: class I SAM-dependent methyltransferase [Chlorobi bacterium]|nr:class I SAM-dependent methyltransferase [Chlorobiota bacterium]
MFEEQLWYSGHVIHEYWGCPDYAGKKVLEIGCAEGGGLHFFAEKGAQCFGLEYSPSRYRNALEMDSKKGITFLLGDFLSPEMYKDKIPDCLDYIILRDVIEHLKDKRFALNIVYDLLTKGGKLFLSFPPKYSPFAGHQQVVTNKFGKLPYLYLLPVPLYKSYLRLLSQPEKRIENLLTIKKLRISLSRMERMLTQIGFHIEQEDLYIIRPCYERRFGWKCVKNPLSRIPVVREITTLGSLFVVSK